MFLIDTINPKVKRNSKIALFYKGWGVGSVPVLFLLALGLLAATKFVFKRNAKFIFSLHVF